MRKIVAGLFMSLDGVVESPSQWLLFNAEMQQMIATGIAQSDAILLGRRTYLEFADLWPKQRGSPMADYMNETPKYVASRTLQAPLEWKQSRLIDLASGGLAAALNTLKRQPGRNIQIPGSPRLVRSLLREGLLDELGLMIHPVVVGSGLRLFEEMTERIPLELVAATTLSTGVLSVTYRPARM